MDEIDAAARRAEELRLCPATDSRKSWDNVAAADAICAEVGRTEPVVDLGCRSGILLTWLHQLGYRQLWGCDLRAPYPPLLAALRSRRWSTLAAGLSMYVSQRRTMRRRPVEQTGFPTGHFAAATSLSVIEHGVDVERFLAEAARLLRSDGLLVVSTDYWPEPLETRGMQRFDVAGPDRIFDRRAITELLAAARAQGLKPYCDAPPGASEPVIEDSGLRYTFLLLGFRKT